MTPQRPTTNDHSPNHVTTVTGTKLVAAQDPLRITRAGYALLMLLSAALLLSVFGLTLRALDISERQHQMERV